MAFLNIPLKVIQADLSNSASVESMPWYNPSDFPVPPGNPYPLPIQKDYRWRVTLNISLQQQSSYLTRHPGVYNGLDVSVGQWVANITSGQAWQIISIESKTTSEVIAIVQDVYRYNTFKDTAGVGNGAPSIGIYIIFSLSDEGLPQIDPIPPSGVSTQFGVNILSRFEYINLQYDYPLYAEGNTFVMNDVIAADDVNHTFILADDTHRTVIGRITSISDIKPGWFTVNPVQKVVDNLDFLPGDVGDTIYTDLVNPGEITVTPGGSALYVNLRKNTQSITSSSLPGPTSPGNTFQLNEVDITVGGSGNSASVISAVNLETASTGVVATSELLPTEVTTNVSLLSPTYGEVVLEARTTPASATINGVQVTFDITSTSPGYEDYTQAPQMVQSINNAAIPNIVASLDGSYITLTNTTGATITIVNLLLDANGVPFAGSNSGSGLALNTTASTTSRINFTAVDARAINFLDVVGSTTIDFGLTSVENGIKAAGLYIQEGLRQGSTTVVLDMTQLNGLSPMIGDQAYVIDSAAQGADVGEWSMWLYDGTEWVQTSNEDSAATDARSLEQIVFYNTTGSPIEIGKLSNGRKVTQVLVEVNVAFNGANPTLSVGVEGDPANLIDNSLIDLKFLGLYGGTTDFIYTGIPDIPIIITFDFDASTAGAVNVIITYV